MNDSEITIPEFECEEDYGYGKGNRKREIFFYDTYAVLFNGFRRTHIIVTGSATDGEVSLKIDRFRKPHSTGEWHSFNHASTVALTKDEWAVIFEMVKRTKTTSPS